ncbi:chemotaxis protein CheD [Notoacmeibacter ruber]|uniref:Probable chemoreceptor glutamine deamidase CheD n=1 Tax=Notoacmeibacter ruber TaxID=2670375 RepID=A0A3L7JGQ6_9HYPH|nr:chemotaxis protein CheD [Notoacmeibacter ruber]RLQ88801.1 chemotaxis protein CheD [Notoacmeibacter ruber]
MTAMGSHRTIVGQGEYAVTKDPNTTLSAVLGSCVACCAYDPVRGLGGMNHILLPGNTGASHDEQRGYGAWLMEMMLNEMFKTGASRSDIRVKLFGGARMFASNWQPGEENIAFVREFLRAEGYPVTAEDLGGHKARRVNFQAHTGRAWVKAIDDKVVEQPVKPVPQRQAADDVDFF